jgi:hypothetical protein
VNDRVNACLDEDLPLEALTDAERAEVQAVRALAQRIRAEAPSSPARLPDTVLCRIRELGLDPAAAPAAVAEAGVAAAAPDRGGWFRRTLEAAWQPRRVAFAFRPAYAGGVLALVAAVLLVRTPAGETPAGGELAAVAPPVYVQFRLDAAGAASVALAGSFSDWEPSHQLVETRPGVWTLVLALEPGVHDYAFIVDGDRWVVDPAAPSVADGFGGENSRLALLPAGGTEL